MIVTSCWDSPLGRVTMAAEDGALTGLWLEGQRWARAGAENAPRNDAAAPFAATRAWLAAYFAGEQPPVGEIPIRLHGTAFRVRVWRELTRIPYGRVVTYHDLARALGSVPRAVGGAVGHNPISILVPCHRVIGADGGLTGYAGGLENKKRLLALEGIDPARVLDWHLAE